MPHTIGLLPLHPTHENTLKGSTSSGLHENVNPHFTLVRRRSCSFGSGSSDYTHFHTLRLVTCAHIAFALDTFLSEIILATKTNSLPYYPKHTLQLWIKLIHYHHLAITSFKNLPFEPQHAVTTRFQVLFTSISGYFSALGRPTNSLSVSESI